MNADAFRQLYDYHFAENRALWERYVPELSDEQFTENTGYSHGSVREQILHLMSVDDAWFSDLRGRQEPGHVEPDEQAGRAEIRAYGDAVEQAVRGYLATLQDDMLFEKPFPAGEDENLILWQVLIHVVNHGTDHRAQILRQLNDMGIETAPQDYIFYVYDHA